MLKTVIAAGAVLVLAACGKEDRPDPHFPQVSVLIAMSGSTVDCHKSVAPTGETWGDTAGWCEYACVYSGTQLFKGLHVDFSRPTTADAWAIGDAQFAPIESDADCPGVSR